MARLRERIPVIIKALSESCRKEKVSLQEFLVNTRLIPRSVLSYKLPDAKLGTINSYWLDNPDLRLTQVLVNLSYIPNISGHWYYTEESDWAIREGICTERDLIFWKSYGKYGDEIAKIRPLKELEYDHIMAILQTQNHISLKLRRSFLQELLYRTDDEIKSSTRKLRKSKHS